MTDERMLEALEKIAAIGRNGLCLDGWTTPPMGSGLSPKWIGCDAYRNGLQDSLCWCPYCEAQAALSNQEIENTGSEETPGWFLRHSRKAAKLQPEIRLYADDPEQGIEDGGEALSTPARRTSTEFEVDESGHEVEVLDEWMAQVYDLSGAPLPKKEPRVVIRNRENGRIRMSYRLPWGTIGSGDMGREAAERIATLAGLEKEETS